MNVGKMKRTGIESATLRLPIPEAPGSNWSRKLYH